MQRDITEGNSKQGRSFDRKLAILFDVEKKSRRGEFTKLN